MEMADICSSGRLDVEVTREDAELVRLRSFLVIVVEGHSSGMADMAAFVEVEDVGRARFRGMTISLIDSSLELTVLELGILVDVVGEPSDRPPYDVPLRTDLNEREELVELVDAVRVEGRVDGGTGADGRGGNETEGKSLRDLDVVDEPAVAMSCGRAPLFGGPWS
jgi:hypothetical protein